MLKSILFINIVTAIFEDSNDFFLRVVQQPDLEGVNININIFIKRTGTKSR